MTEFLAIATFLTIIGIIVLGWFWWKNRKPEENIIEFKNKIKFNKKWFFRITMLVLVILLIILIGVLFRHLYEIELNEEKLSFKLNFF